jgi:hypothetical protein
VAKKPEIALITAYYRLLPLIFMGGGQLKGKIQKAKLRRLVPAPTRCPPGLQFLLS